MLGVLVAKPPPLAVGAPWVPARNGGGSQAGAAVGVKQEDVLAVVASSGNVVRCADRRHPRLAGHGWACGTTMARSGKGSGRISALYLRTQSAVGGKAADLKSEIHATGLNDHADTRLSSAGSTLKLKVLLGDHLILNSIGSHYPTRVRRGLGVGGGSLRSS